MFSFSNFICRAVCVPVFCLVSIMARASNEGADTLLLPADEGIYIGPGGFSEMGDWKVDGFGMAMQKIALSGSFSKQPKGLRPARVYINVEKSGTYSIWASSLDLAHNQQGTRFFYLKADGRLLDKRLGSHNTDGFLWEETGQVFLEAGPHTIELLDSSAFYARCEGLYITTEKGLNAASVKAKVRSGLVEYKPHDLGKPLVFPSNAVVKKEATLKNGFLDISFVELENAGRSLVENQVRFNGVQVKPRSSSLALILLKTETSSTYYHEGFPIFQNKVMSENGKDLVAIGKNPFETFYTSWLLPHKLEVLSEKRVRIEYDSEDFLVNAVWELKENDQEPVVTLTMQAKKNGVYSLVIPGYGSFSNEEYEFALAPMRVANKHAHPETVVYTEQYLFTPMSSVTIPEDNRIAPGKKLTYGVVVDPSAIPLKWTYNDNNEFGAMLRDHEGKVSPSLIAPFPGSPASKFDRGSSHVFRYRPVMRTGDWFSSYKHVVADIFQLRDYRENYYSTLNDAIFETTRLMKDDYYGGWDSIGKAHWNMEGRSFSSNANPAQAIQSYLLSEDDTILRKRAIPTLANLLTREHLHFKWNDLKGGANYFGDKTTLPRPVGTPIKGYNSSVFYGLYQFSKGRIPYLREIAAKKANEKVVNAYGSIPPFYNDMAQYKLSGDSASLNKAIEGARLYIQQKVFSSDTTPVGYSLFSYISYVPNISSLLEMYEATQLPEFLRAAEEAGRILLTQLWVTGITNPDVPDSMLISAAEIKAKPFNEGYDFFWHGDNVWRLGSRPGKKGPPENLDILKDEKVPYWVPSRVGLGLEQPSTFYHESLNMIMSSWAGDLMKLAGYTGEELFAAAARNAIIGRFSNYPGYYQNRFITIQQKADYPYTGPDFSSVYWHHIPPFLAQLEDFLFAQTQVWSEGKISFPSFRQQGYAYFNSNQYGYGSGNFFDENNMWPWLATGIVNTGHKQVDFLAARKDGVAGIAFMNESPHLVNTTISLGEKLGTGHTGEAVLLFPDGRKQQVLIRSGKLDISMPGHSLVGLLIKNTGINAPAYAKAVAPLKKSKDLTITDHGYGKGLVLQLDPSRYFSYIYVSEKPGLVKKATVFYKTGKALQQQSTTQYPFEFIIEVDDIKKEFEYFLQIEMQDGSIKKTRTQKLRSLGY